MNKFILLFFAASDFKIFAILHFTVKKIYLNIVFPIVSFQLKKNLAVLYCFARRSVKSHSGQFNLFFSDLDFGVVIRNDAAESELKQLVNQYYALKRFFPFLGELEIYTELEIKRLELLHRETNFIYDSLREHRKINWTKNKLRQKPGSIYHRFKDHRSIELFKRKYKIGSTFESVFNDQVLASKISDMAENKLKVDPEPFSETTFFCNYLSQKVRLNPVSNEILRKLVLLSCVPTLNKGNPVVQQLCAQLRKQNPIIAKIFVMLNDIEFIIASAYIRGCKSKEDWHQDWLRELQCGLTSLPVDQNSVVYS